MTIYNNTLSFPCGIVESPQYCHQSNEVGCKRGEGTWTYLLVSIGYAMFCNIIIVPFVTMLIYENFNQEQTIDKYLTRGHEQRWVYTKKTTQ
jgi:hypothetical protein